MSGSEVQIVFTADVSEVIEGVTLIKVELTALAPALEQVTAQFSRLGEAAQSSTTQAAASGDKMDEAFRKSVSTLVELSGSLAGLGEKVKLALGAADLVEKWSQTFAESSEQVQKTGKQFGLTVAQVQALHGASAQSGASLNILAQSAATLDKNVESGSGKTSALGKALAAMGVSAGDGRGKIDRLVEVTDRLKAMPEGPQRATLAFQLMGQSGQQLIPVIAQNADSLGTLIDRSKQYGVVNQEAEERGLKLAEAVNQSKAAWLGLETTLGDAFAPLLTQIVSGFNNVVQQMVASYNHGGAVKQMFESLSEAGAGVMKFIGALTPLFRTLADNSKSLIGLIELLSVAMAAKYAAGIVTAIVKTEALQAAIFAIEAVAGGAATVMEGLALVASEAATAMLAAFGGPIGIAIAALGFALYELYQHMSAHVDVTAKYAQVEKEAANAAAQTTDIVGRLATAHGKAREEAENEAKANIKDAQAKLANAYSTTALAAAERELANAKNRQEQDSEGDPISIGAVRLSRWLSGGGSDANDVAQAQAKVDAIKDLRKKYLNEIQALKAALAQPIADGANLNLAGGKHTEKKSDSRMTVWENDLAQQKLALEKKAEAQGTFDQISLRDEADYWQKVAERHDLSREEYNSAEKKYLDLRMEFRKQEFEAHEASSLKEIDAAKGNYDKQMQLAHHLAVEVGLAYGEQSKQYEAAKDRFLKIERDKNAELDRLTNELADHRTKVRLQDIDESEEAAKHRVAMGQATEQQLLTQERDFENQRYTIAREGLDKRLAAMATDPNSDKEAYQKLALQIDDLDRQHQAALTKNAQQAALQRTATERQVISQIASSWGQAFGKLLTFQQGFAATLKQLWQGVQQTLGNVIGKIVEQWLEKWLTALIIGSGEDKAAAATKIANQAAVAGAGGVASMAAAPYPFDMTAPAFGAGMATAAGSYASMLAVSAEGGWDVPGMAGPGIDGRGGRMSIIHPHEMVLPAALANPMRDMFGSRAANGNSPIAANDATASDFHYHDHTGTTNPRQIFANRQALAHALVKAHEEGAFRGTRLSFSR